MFAIVLCSDVACDVELQRDGDVGVKLELVMLVAFGRVDE